MWCKFVCGFVLVTRRATGVMFLREIYELGKEFGKSVGGFVKNSSMEFGQGACLVHLGRYIPSRRYKYPGRVARM